MGAGRRPRIAIEAREDRAANIRSNAAAFGLAHRIKIVTGSAPDALAGLEKPDAVFVGGGLDAAMFDAIWSLLREGARLVAHRVTLETEALLDRIAQRAWRRADADRDRACGAARRLPVLGGVAPGRAMERGEGDGA